MSERSNLVKSVIKALDLMEVLAGKGELSIGELNDHLGWDKSTIHRLLSTLREKGYVQQNSQNQKYRAGIKMFEIGNQVVERLGFRRQCQPYLESLAAMTKETVNLAVRDGKDIIYIDKIESSATIKVDLAVGKRLPMYCTGLGKAILAHMPEQEALNILQSETMIAHTPKTLVTPEAIQEQLALIRQKGYSLDDEEYVEGLVCVAAPIRNHRGEVMAALSIAVPQYRFVEGERTLHYTKKVAETAGKISSELGGFQL